MEADLGLLLLGNPRASTSSGQLQTMSEHHHTAPTELVLHRGLVVSGHSQSLKLTGLGKSLPLICQQQSNLNYKRRVYSAHMKGTPGVHSLSDRRGYATGYYIRPHYQDRGSQKLYLIQRNKHREAAKMRRQRNMPQMKELIKTPGKELKNGDK